MELVFVLSIDSTFLLHAYQVEAANVIIFYWLLDIGHCLHLKHYTIIDVCVVVFGFILRTPTGGYATDIRLSKWIALMTFLLMLLLPFARRRGDAVRMSETGHVLHQNTIRYNLMFTNQAIMIIASATLACYIIYTVSPETIVNLHMDHLYLISVFILLELLRYIQISIVDKKGGDPTKVMIHNCFIQLTVLAFELVFLFIIHVLKSIQ